MTLFTLKPLIEISYIVRSTYNSRRSQFVMEYLGNLVRALSHSVHTVLLCCVLQCHENLHLNMIDAMQQNSEL